MKNSYMLNEGKNIYGKSVEQVYLWSKLSLIKRFFLLPIYFLLWNWLFIKNYWINNIYVEFFEEVSQDD